MCVDCVTERVWVPPRPANRGHPDHRQLHAGSAVLRGRHCAVHQPRRITQEGVRVYSPRGTTKVPWCQV